MADTPDWMVPLDAEGGPIYLQIVTALEAAIAHGVLRPGERLPPQRQLAERLGIDLTTVTRAYSEARHRNLLDAVTGRGSFVSAGKARTAPAVDLSMNIPPPPRGLRLSELIARGISAVLARSDADHLMSYHVGPGAQADRAAGALWLEPVLGPVSPERLVLSAGAQPALAALLSTLARPGDVVLTEQLTYPGLLSAAAHFGLRVIGVETDVDGILPEALAAACRVHAPRLLHVMPTIHNPTATTMPEARRVEVARVAAEAGLILIEDDPYSLLAQERPSPLARLLPAQTYYVATVSKCLTPGLRAAYVVLPEGQPPDSLVGALRTLTLMPAPLMTALLTRWIREGTAQQLLEGVREEATARQALARALLPESAVAHPNGLHVWQPLPGQWDRYRLMEAARQQGLGVTPSDAFNVAGRAPDAVRISLGAVADRARLTDALKTLAAIIRDQRPDLHGVV